MKIKTKRFLLFCGNAYYPNGGWDDYVGDFETIKQAQDKLKTIKRYDWFQIIDLKTGEEI